MFKFFTSYTVRFVSICFLVLLLGMFVYHILNKQLNKKFLKRASAKGYEIEIFEDSNDSYFDKYLNEVLYVFRNSKKDIFVFEDIDRFDDSIIFEKLREINSLLNKQVEDRTIKFVYMLKDDMFESKDRTKFFEFIVPVIPMVDSNNSFEKMKEKLKEAGIFDKFNEKFLSDVSLYIDEYRILKNIFNEYLVYHSKLMGVNLDCNKLLAIVIYKNIFPRDFGELQLNKGYLKEVLNKKENLIEKVKSTYEEKIIALKKEIDNIESIVADSIDELDASYLTLNGKVIINNMLLNGTNNQLQIIKKIKENNYNVEFLEASTGSSYKYYIPYNFKNDFDKLHDNKDYELKYQYILEGKDNSINRINKEIENIEQEIKSIQKKGIKDLITRDNKSEFFNIEKNKDYYAVITESSYFELLKYLICSGYIEEDSYSDYISYFMANSISKNDKIFLRSLTDQVALMYDYKINSPTQVVKRIDDRYYDEIEILNFDLLSYMLSLSSFNMNLETVINQIIREKEFGFVMNYFKTRRNTDILSKKLLTDISFLTELIASPCINQDDKPLLIVHSLLFTQVSYNESLKEYIEKNSDFLYDPDFIIYKENFVTNPDTLYDLVENETIYTKIAGITQKISKQSITFEELRFNALDSNLSKVLYTNNSYRINISNIKEAISNFYGIQITKDTVYSLYTVISKDIKQPLYKYISNNINEFMKNYLNSVEFVKDEEKEVLELLNNDAIEKGMKQKYIDILVTKINDISLVIEKEFWSPLLEKNLIVFNQSNIVNYYFEYDEVNQNLINFINDSEKDLVISFDEIKEKYGCDNEYKIFSDLVRCNKLSNRQYKSLLHNSISIPCFSEFIIPEIENDKIDILIKTNRIEMNENNLDFIRDNYVESINTFININSDEYTKIINKSNFDMEELIIVLSSNKFSNKQKISLMSHIEEEIPFDDSYSNEVKEHIIKFNSSDENYQKFADLYLSQSMKNKTAIKDLFIEEIEQIIDSKIVVSLPLLDILVKYSGLDDQQKLELINNSLIQLNANDIKNLFMYIEDECFKDVFDNKHPCISINKVNKEILDQLLEKSIISSYKKFQKIDGDEFYRVFTGKSKR